LKYINGVSTYVFFFSKRLKTRGNTYFFGRNMYFLRWYMQMEEGFLLNFGVAGQDEGLAKPDR